MKTSEKLIIAAAKIDEATELCYEALKELNEGTGREFLDVDSQIGMSSAVMTDAIAFLIGTALLNDKKGLSYDKKKST